MKPIDADFSQTFLLPPCLEDWVGKDHPVRFIREFVESLDLDELGFPRQDATEGRPPYAHPLLLRIWLYGYWKNIRSVRKLEAACQDDIGFIWLCGGHRPDHNSIWRFFHAHRKQLKSLFKQTVRAAMDLDLVGTDLQALDGTKIQARCSGREGYSKDQLEELDQALEKQITEIEDELEERGDSAGNVRESAKLPKDLQEKKRLQAKVREARAVAETEGASHVHPQDTSARRMGCEGRNRFSYNAQAVVDEQHQVVVASDVTLDANDHKQLVRMTREANELRGRDVLTVADSGYATSMELGRADGLGLPVLVNLNSSQLTCTDKPYHSSQFTPSADRRFVTCPEGRQIPFQRARIKDGALRWVYRSAQMCKGCPAMGICTRDRHGRSIDLYPGLPAVRAMELKLTESKSKRDLAQRKAIVEPVFGRIKEHGAFRRWSFHGQENVTSQWHLLCGVHNLKVIFKHRRRTIKAEAIAMASTALKRATQRFQALINALLPPKEQRATGTASTMA